MSLRDLTDAQLVTHGAEYHREVQRRHRVRQERQRRIEFAAETARIESGCLCTDGSYNPYRNTDERNGCPVHPKRAFEE